MLAPKKVKYRKQQKGRRGGTAFRGATLAHGDFGLQAAGQGAQLLRVLDVPETVQALRVWRGSRDAALTPPSL